MEIVIVPQNGDGLITAILMHEFIKFEKSIPPDIMLIKARSANALNAIKIPEHISEMYLGAIGITNCAPPDIRRFINKNLNKLKLWIDLYGERDSLKTLFPHKKKEIYKCSPRGIIGPYSKTPLHSCSDLTQNYIKSALAEKGVKEKIMPEEISGQLISAANHINAPHLHKEIGLSRQIKSILPGLIPNGQNSQIITLKEIESLLNLQLS